MNLRLVFISIIAITYTQSISCQKFELLVNGGYGYRIFSISDSVSESLANYIEKKRPGFVYNAELIWFSEDQGIGVKYSSFLNSINGKGLKLSVLEKIDKTEDIGIDFYSLQYHNRHQFSNYRFFGDFAIGLGYVRYSSIGKEFEEDIDISSSTYGLSATLGFDFKIIKYLTFNISSNLFIANIKELKENGFTVNLNKSEGLTHVDICAGLRFIY